MVIRYSLAFYSSVCNKNKMLTLVAIFYYFLACLYFQEVKLSMCNNLHQLILAHALKQWKFQ